MFYLFDFAFTTNETGKRNGEIVAARRRRVRGGLDLAAARFRRPALLRRRAGFTGRRAVPAFYCSWRAARTDPASARTARRRGRRASPAHSARTRRRLETRCRLHCVPPSTRDRPARRLPERDPAFAPGQDILPALACDEQLQEPRHPSAHSPHARVRVRARPTRRKNRAEVRRDRARAFR